MSNKTKLDAIFRATPGGKSEAAVLAYRDARARVFAKQTEFQQKYGRDMQGRVYANSTHIWVQADTLPEPKRHWKKTKFGYVPSCHASEALKAEYRETILPDESAFVKMLEPSAAAVEPFIFSQGGRCFSVHSPIMLSMYGDTAFVHVSYLGELGDDPPWCPPDAERVSEIEYGKVVKAARDEEEP